MLNINKTSNIVNLGGNVNMEGVPSSSRGSAGKFSNIHTDKIVKTQKSNLNL